MGPLPTGTAQSWLTVAAVVLSQLFTLLLIGGIAHVLRRKGRVPLGERSLPRGAAAAAKGIRAGRLSGRVQPWAVASVIVGLTLLSPIFAFLMVISAEILIDLLIEAGTTAVCAVAVGAVGWVLFRKISSQSDAVVPSQLKHEPDEGAIAVPPV
jgi:hypothetical protein